MSRATAESLLIRISNGQKERMRLIGEKGKVAERMEAVGLTPAGLNALTLTYVEIENRLTQVLNGIRESRVELDRIERSMEIETLPAKG